MNKDFCYPQKPSEKYLKRRRASYHRNHEIGDYKDKFCASPHFTVEELAIEYTRITGEKAPSNTNHLIIDCLLSEHIVELIPYLDSVYHYSKCGNTELLRTEMYFRYNSENRTISRIDISEKTYRPSVTFFNILAQYSLCKDPIYKLHFGSDYSKIFEYILDRWYLFYDYKTQLIWDIFYSSLTHTEIISSGYFEFRTFQLFFELFQDLIKSDNINGIQLLNDYQRHNKIVNYKLIFRLLNYDYNNEYEIFHASDFMESLLEYENFCIIFDRFEKQFSQRIIENAMFDCFELRFPGHTDGCYADMPYLENYYHMYKRGYRLCERPNIKNMLYAIDNGYNNVLETLDHLLPIKQQRIMDLFIDEFLRRNNNSDDDSDDDYECEFSAASYKQLIEYNGNFVPIDFDQLKQPHNANFNKSFSKRFDLNAIVFMGICGYIHVHDWFHPHKYDMNEYKLILHNGYTIDKFLKYTKCTPNINTWKYNFMVMLRFERKTMIITDNRGVSQFKVDKF